MFFFSKFLCSHHLPKINSISNTGRYLQVKLILFLTCIVYSLILLMHYLTWNAIFCQTLRPKKLPHCTMSYFYHCLFNQCLMQTLIVQHVIKNCIYINNHTTILCIKTRCFIKVQDWYFYCKLLFEIYNSLILTKLN